MDLKQYRLTDWNWIDTYKNKYGAEYFHGYMNKVFNMLSDLKPGRCYDLSTVAKQNSKIFNVTYINKGKSHTEYNPDFFVKTVCLYMLSFQDYEFSDDYSKIIHRT